MTEDLQADAQAAYDRRTAEVGDEVMRELERRVVLSVLDRKWREHLYEMDYLREGIYLRAYSQRDPLVEYQREGFDMFTAMMNGIKEESVGFLFNLEVSVDETDTADAHDEVIEVEEPMRQEVPAFGEPAAPAPEVPHIRARGLERPSQPQRLTYSGPEEGVAELGDDNAAVSSTVTNEGDPYAGVGRNAECPCGSGKKFKKCHGAPGGPHRAHRPRQRRAPQVRQHPGEGGVDLVGRQRPVGAPAGDVGDPAERSLVSACPPYPIAMIRDGSHAVELQPRLSRSRRSETLWSSSLRPSVMTTSALRRP